MMLATSVCLKYYYNTMVFLVYYCSALYTSFILSHIISEEINLREEETEVWSHSSRKFIYMLKQWGSA